MKRSEFKALRRDFLARTVDELLGLLASEDLQTRFFAEMALRDKSGT